MDNDDNAQFAPSLMIDSADERTDSPGRQLRYARERRSLTLERVASDLRLSIAIVTALENDDYSGLPSPVFVSGYLNSYARLVGLDPAPLLAHYRGVRPTVELPVCGPALPKITTIRSSHLLMRLMSGAVILALTSGVTLWWINHRPQDAILPVAPQVMPTTPTAPAAPPAHSSAIPPDVMAPLPLPNRPAPPAIDAPVVPPTSAPLPAPSPPPAPSSEPRPQRGRDSGSLVADATAADATAIASAPPPPVVKKNREVAVSFKAPCWVDIRDASGRFKLIGEMRKGTRHVLAGEPPYSIIFGNATAVDMRVDGKVFDVRAQSRGNIARFKFDSTE
ncbi:helix-turn-helix domain-containing protein [Rhodoferax sp. 4810]|uniref:Helix-turn-helix domain-containing protein n=1 Tax=Thiospirillum jenense TaxID=1653858 RepID=A0A839HEB4_9GAMM|nr:RodZ domain-containing protein [Thiospirillum jenense]MBB1074335.1 helix-turn-helix domain-containing protein [Rhodoferax jenense]MBB1126460.1 helix-turn-helix domain-containing protein [Thiospirillum jenense]